MSSFFIFNRITSNEGNDELDTIKKIDDNKENYSFTLLEDFDVPTYVKSEDMLFLSKIEEQTYIDVKEKNSIYLNKSGDLKVTLTTRFFSQNDKINMIRVENHTEKNENIELIQLRKNISKHNLTRYDRFPIKKTENLSFGEDISTYPIGMEQFIDEKGNSFYRMLGKTFISKQMIIEYSNGDKSTVRDLINENVAYRQEEIKDTFMSTHSFNSKGNDIVETWWIESRTPLFNSTESMDNWMKETAENSRSRNMWYTVDGPIKKMASAVEPIPDTGQGFGRLLLSIKDERALTKYKETKEHYFTILLRNSFVDLIKYKGESDYWKTEVTSTWLKRMYGMTAPFIDTRFNELIALFIYEAGKELGYDNYKSGVENYANLLIQQVEKGSIIQSQYGNGYYIQDYFSVNQEIKTHSSLNHLLGGLNILLLGYQELGHEDYLSAANKILIALEEDKELWVRKDNGDLWYQILIDKKFNGDDYQHLTMADLAYTYQLLENIDENSKYLKTIAFLLQSKFIYLNDHELGSSEKLRRRLKEIGKEEYIPIGPELIEGK